MFGLFLFIAHAPRKLHFMKVKAMKVKDFEK